MAFATRGMGAGGVMYVAVVSWIRQRSTGTRHTRASDSMTERVYGGGAPRKLPPQTHNGVHTENAALHTQTRRLTRMPRETAHGLNEKSTHGSKQKGRKVYESVLKGSGGYGDDSHMSDTNVPKGMGTIPYVRHKMK